MANVSTGLVAAPRRGTVLIAVLAAAGISVSLMQTLVIPLVPQLPELLGTTSANASWAITATLLTGAVATPMFGRLGDMFGAKRVLIACAALLTVGSVVVALTSSLIPLIVGRALQGFGAPVIPLGISVLRASLPAERVGSAMGLVSASLGVGGALGLPLSAVIAQHFSWHALFWFAAALGLFSGLLFAMFVPDIVPSRTMGRFDFIGAVGLAAGLVMLLLPISKGSTWGWTSATTLGLLVGSIVVLGVFGWWQWRAPAPLVDLRTTIKPPVLLTNLSSIAVGFGMFASSLIGPQLLQMPREAGGLGQGMITAGLWMAPGGLAMMASAPLAAKIIAARGPKFTLVLGCVVISSGYLVGTQWLGSPAGVMAFAMIGSAGVGFAFAALPTLINAAVPVSETAAANGINSLARSLGTSTASAVLAAVLAQMTVEFAGHAVPSLDGFRTALIIAAIAAAIAAAVALSIPTSMPVPAQSENQPVMAPALSRRRAQRLEYVLTTIGRQTAVGLGTPWMADHLDRGDYLIAAFLATRGPLDIRELAHDLDSAVGPVEERVAQLIRTRMVSRVATSDRSAPPRFALTPRGRETFDRQMTARISGLEAILAQWDDGDTAALIGYLGRLSDGIDEEGRRRASRMAPQHRPPDAYTEPMRDVTPPARWRPNHPWSAPADRTDKIMHPPHAADEQQTERAPIRRMRGPS
jgi:MFS family permease